MAQNNQVNHAFPLAITAGGTGVTSVTSAPTASAWSGWDANKNHSAVGYIPGYTTTVTSASPVTLTVGSNQQQYFTGSTAQQLNMPVANTLVVGQYWSVINNSTQVVTIKSSGGNTILALPAASETVVTCVTASGTDATSWTTSPAVSGSGTVNSGLINQLAWYSASGTAVSGLTIVNSAGLTTTSGGVPTWVAYTGTNAPVLGTAPTISAPKIDFINDQTNNGHVMQIVGVASAVNFFYFTNSATGNQLALIGDGSDTNINMLIGTLGNGTLIFANAAGAKNILTLNGAITSVNYVNISSATTGNAPAISVVGSDSNIGMQIVAKGSGGLNILSNGNPVASFSNTASTVNYLSFIGNTTGNPPVIYAVGSDTNVNLALLPQGTGKVAFANAGSFSANSTTATVLGSLGPAGAHTTVQTWLTIVDNGGTTRYIPCF